MIIYVKLRHSKMYNFKIVVNIKNLCVGGGGQTLLLLGKETAA